MEDEDATTGTIDEPDVGGNEMIVSLKLVLAIGPMGPIGSPGVV